METVRDRFIKVAGELKTQEIDEQSGIKIEVNYKLRFSRGIKNLVHKEQRLLN